MNKRNSIPILVLLLIAGVTAAQTGSYDSSVTLENKDSSWAIINDGYSATVEYNACGTMFEWRAHGVVPQIGECECGCYALIYYADKENRYVNWRGDNPGGLIGTFNVDQQGGFDTGNRYTELNMNLPTSPDWNINPDPADMYCTAPDNYVHCSGAKLWIVPCTDYSTPAMITWNSEKYLFETDLIWYDDTDVEPRFCEDVNCDGVVCFEGDLYDMACVDGTCVRNDMIEADCPSCYVPHDPCGGKLCDGLVCVGYDLYSMLSLIHI